MNNILLSIYLPDYVYNLGMLLSPVLLYKIKFTIYNIHYTIYNIPYTINIICTIYITNIHTSGRISYIILGSILSGYARHSFIIHSVNQTFLSNSVRCKPIYLLKPKFCRFGFRSKFEIGL